MAALLKGWALPYVCAGRVLPTQDFADTEVGHLWQATRGVTVHTVESSGGFARLLGGFHMKGMELVCMFISAAKGVWIQR